MAAPIVMNARQGDTLDSLAWRERGLGPADLGPLLLANPGLADAGAVLPLNTVVTVPATSATPAPTVRDVVNLWN